VRPAVGLNMPSRNCGGYRQSAHCRSVGQAPQLAGAVTRPLALSSLNQDGLRLLQHVVSNRTLYIGPIIITADTSSTTPAVVRRYGYICASRAGCVTVRQQSKLFGAMTAVLNSNVTLLSLPRHCQTMVPSVWYGTATTAAHGTLSPEYNMWVQHTPLPQHMPSGPIDAPKGHCCDDRGRAYRTAVSAAVPEEKKRLRHNDWSRQALVPAVLCSAESEHMRDLVRRVGLRVDAPSASWRQQRHHRCAHCGSISSSAPAGR
jgi:hypothetical protein